MRPHSDGAPITPIVKQEYEKARTQAREVVNETRKDVPIPILPFPWVAGYEDLFRQGF